MNDISIAEAGMTAMTAYLLLAAVGAALFYGSLRRWKWLVEPDTGTRPLGILVWLYRIWGLEGYRTGMMVLSAILVLCSLFLAFTM